MNRYSKFMWYPENIDVTGQTIGGPAVASDVDDLAGLESEMDALSAEIVAEWEVESRGDDMGHGYNPNRAGNGQFGSGQHHDRKAARAERAQGHVDKAAGHLSTIAAKRQASEAQHATSKATAAASMKQSKAAKALAKKDPTAENVATWHASTKQAIRDRATAAKHGDLAQRHADLHDKAETTHAIAQAKLKEAQRAAPAPVAAARELHGIGFDRVRGEHEGVEVVPSQATRKAHSSSDQTPPDGWSLPQGKRLVDGVPERSALRSGDVYVIQADHISGRLIALPGGGDDKVRLANVAAAQSRGRLAPVKLAMLPDGSLFVEDGRHRLINAMASGRPVVAQIGKASAGSAVGTVPLFHREPVAPTAKPVAAEPKPRGTTSIHQPTSVAQEVAQREARGKASGTRSDPRKSGESWYDYDVRSGKERQERTSKAHATAQADRDRYVVPPGSIPFPEKRGGLPRAIALPKAAQVVGLPPAPGKKRRRDEAENARALVAVAKEYPTEASIAAAREAVDLARSRQDDE